MREKAWRVFAAEYKYSTLEEKGEGEMSPSYVISPLGARLNRILITGTLMEVERRENDVRGSLWDGTDNIQLYVGRYNQEVMEDLTRLSASCYASMTARVRMFSPEEGRKIVIVQPEKIRECSLEEWEYWMISAAEQTLSRLEALGEAKVMNPPTVEKLVSLGYSRDLADGIIKALQHYDDVDLDNFREAISGALISILSGEEVQRSTDADESKLMEIIKKLDKGEGAKWGEVISNARAKGIETDNVEELIMKLQDKGLVEEPLIGLLKIRVRK